MNDVKSSDSASFYFQDTLLAAQIDVLFSEEIPRVNILFAAYV